MRVMITGGTGFVGSHIALAMVEAGDEVALVDNLSNSTADVVREIRSLSGREIDLREIDVRDIDRMVDLLGEHGTEAIIHCAAAKHVAESIERPGHYWDNNVGGLQALLHAADATDVRRIVFSSTGSIYGDADRLPIPEDEPHYPTNPYSKSKSVGEQALRLAAQNCADWQITALRYFNPAGAHRSGRLADQPAGPISNLIPMILDVAAGNRPVLEVTGDDFDTPDGTGIRDYIHIDDVVDAHIAALAQLEPGFQAFNIGTGVGTSVLELVEAAEEVAGAPIPTVTRPRRPGDVAALVADPTKADRVLGIRSERTLHDILTDAWRARRRASRQTRHLVA